MNRLHIVSSFIALIAVGLLVLWVWPSINRLLYPNPFLTVNEIWDNPEAWHGQRVTVRGWAALEVSDPATQNECFPNLCQCVLNETDFVLTGRTAAQKIRVRDLECLGEACPRMCIGRDTDVSAAYALVGTLQVRRGAKKSLCYWMVAGMKNGPDVISKDTSRFVSDSLCRSKRPLVQRIWTPVNDYYAQYFYSIELIDVDLADVQRLDGIGGLAGLWARPVSDSEFVEVE